MCIKEAYDMCIKEAYDMCIKDESIRNVFRAGGIFPFNHDAVDYGKCIPDHHKEIVHRGGQQK